MPTPVPNLWFDTEALEAAEFYVSVFPNSAITSIQQTPDEAHPGVTSDVLAVNFVLDGQPFTGINGGPAFTLSEAVSFRVPCTDQAEVDHYWDALLAGGGEESQCGWLKDRFGLSWQVTPTRLLDLVTDADPERAARATKAMLGMGKIDIAGIEAAADGLGV